MAELTWRNVANTVTGNPAAALGAANSAFANAGVGADRMAKAAIERDKLARAQTTDDALQSIFGVGDLAGVDQDANFGEILKQRRAQLTGDAQIGADNARQAHSEELTRVSGITNSDEAIAARNKLLETNANTAATRAGTAALAAENTAQAFQREAADRAEIDEVNTQWDQFLGEKTAGHNEFATNEVNRIANTPITDDYTVADQAREISEVRNNHAAVIEEERRAGAIEFTNRWQINNAGKNTVGRPFDIRDVLSDEAKARETIRFDNEQDRLNAAKSDLGSVVAGGKTQLHKLGFGAGNEPHMLDPKDFSGNKITPNIAVRDIKAKGGDSMFKDDKLDERFTNHIKEVVRITGGNRQLYNEVMKDVVYDVDGIPFLGDDDEIEGLPDLGDVEDRVADALTRVNALIAGQKPDKVQSAVDRFYGR